MTWLNAAMIPNMNLKILEIEPEMVHAQDGTWLAVTPPGAPVSLGVIEPTETEARVRFQAALRMVHLALTPEQP